MPFGRRRRPLARAAAVGGAAYYAGKKVQEHKAEDEQAALDDEYVEEEPEASGAVSDNEIEQLKKLAELKDAGVLTAEEFDEQKRKILGT